MYNKLLHFTNLHVNIVIVSLLESWSLAQSTNLTELLAWMRTLFYHKMSKKFNSRAKLLAKFSPYF